MVLIAVFLGGAVGSAARLTISSMIQRRYGGSLPLGTLVVNVCGSFLLGLLLPSLERGIVSAPAQALLSVGLLGSFTTFSTFAFEAVLLAKRGRGAPSRALCYVVVSLCVGIMSFAAGAMITRAGIAPLP